MVDLLLRFVDWLTGGKCHHPYHRRTRYVGRLSYAHYYECDACGMDWTVADEEVYG